MAKHTFTIPFSAPIEEVVSKTKAFIEQSGGSFNGDLQSGSFSGKTPIGKVACDYSVKTDGICLTITQKPMIAPNSTIESTIRKHFKV